MWRIPLTAMLAASSFLSPWLSSAEAADRGARLGRLTCGAGEIAKFDGQRWRCSRDETGDDTARMVLLDATGEEVGALVDVTIGAPTIFGVATQAIVATTAFGEPPILLRFTPADIFGTTGLVGFDGPGCTGSAWIVILSTETLPGPIWTVPAPSSVLIETDRRVLYAPTSEVPEVRTLTSVRSRDNRCNVADGPPGVVLPAEIVEDDLLTTFPPPFRLEISGSQ